MSKYEEGRVAFINWERGPRYVDPYDDNNVGCPYEKKEIYRKNNIVLVQRTKECDEWMRGYKDAQRDFDRGNNRGAGVAINL